MWHQNYKHNVSFVLTHPNAGNGEEKASRRTSGSTSSADGAEEFWGDYTKHNSVICY